MKKYVQLLCGALTLILALTACSGGEGSKVPVGSTPPASSADPASSAGSSGQQQEEIEDWRAEQKIVVNGNTYQFLLKAMSGEEGDPLIVRLDSDVQLTNTACVLGTSDYGGMFNGQEITIPSHNIVLDLNGHTLSAEKGCAVFEVQEGYTLTVVDNSESKSGRLNADGEAVVVENGGTYVPLSD